jgi:amino acid permease
MNLLRRKSVAQLQADALTDHWLKRALGATNLTALGIGAIIGTGIFVLTGTVAAQNAGPAVVLSFVLAGVASIFATPCYGEFASLVPMPVAPTCTATPRSQLGLRNSRSLKRTSVATPGILECKAGL